MLLSGEGGTSSPTNQRAPVVNATHMIVLIAPRGAALEVDRVAEVAQAAGAEVIETRAVPVPVALSDRRTVHKLLVSSL